MKNQPRKTVNAGSMCPLFVVILAVLLFSAAGVAQEKREVARGDFSGGVSLQFDGQQLAGIGDALAISDSLGHKLALLAVTLDGEKRWLRASEEAPELPNVVHWHFDEAAGQLIIDLRGVKDAISAQSNLELSVSVLNTRATQFKLSAYDAVKQADNQPGGLTKLKDVSIEVR